MPLRRREASWFPRPGHRKRVHEGNVIGVKVLRGGSRELYRLRPTKCLCVASRVLLVRDMWLVYHRGRVLAFGFRGSRTIGNRVIVSPSGTNHNPIASKDVRLIILVCDFANKL